MIEKRVLIIDDTYANRELRAYEKYAPTLRSERAGLKVCEAEETNETDKEKQTKM